MFALFKGELVGIVNNPEHVVASSNTHSRVDNPYSRTFTFSVRSC